MRVKRQEILDGAELESLHAQIHRHFQESHAAILKAVRRKPALLDEIYPDRDKRRGDLPDTVLAGMRKNPEAALRRAAPGWLEAFRRLVRHHLPLAVAFASRYERGFGLEPGDLVASATVGLMAAFVGHDPAIASFSTYAMYWLRHSVFRELAVMRRMVRFPHYMNDRIRAIARARDKLRAALGRAPADEELAHETGLDREQVEEVAVLQYREEISSLSHRATGWERQHRQGRMVLPIPDVDDEYSGAEDIESVLSHFEDPETLYASKQEYRCLGGWLKALRPIELDVVKRRFGFGDPFGEGDSLRDVGDAHRLSRERVRQLQEQAIKKIRARIRKEEALPQAD